MQLPLPKPDVVFCPVENGAVLLSTAEEVYFSLNEVGARIWQLLPPAMLTLDQLCEAVSASYPDAPPDMIREDAEALLAELLAQGLVTPSAPQPSH